jgi:hypothetical protein
MSAVPKGVLESVLLGLSANPDLLSLVVGSRDHPGEIWTRRLDTERFNAQEALGHLADWEAIFTVRLRQTLKGSLDELPNPDPWLLRETNHYAELHPREALERIRRNRVENLEFLKSLSDDEWDRAGLHPTRGPMTLEVQAIHMLAHDGYHFRQLLDLLGLGGG